MKRVLSFKEGMLLALSFFFLLGLSAQSTINIINAEFEEGNPDQEYGNSFLSGETGSILGVDHISLYVSNTFPDNAKILPMGDSRVEGYRPEHESYRYELWKNLIDNNRTFDFIGTQTDFASYPDYKARSFDHDHEGTGGATSEYILENLNNIFSAIEVPDIVLLGIGGNDILDGGYSMSEVVKNINSIIDTIQRFNPYVKIFLEQIAPGLSTLMSPEMTELFDSFNDRISDIPSEQSDGFSSVIAVDMATGWSDEYLADDVHYNETGAKVVADRYIQAFEMLYEQPDIPVNTVSPDYRSEKKELFVYPNPVINGEIRIKGDGFYGTTLIKVCDIFGHIIASKQFDNHDLDANPRIKNGTVDMGAYEFFSSNIENGIK